MTEPPLLQLQQFQAPTDVEYIIQVTDVLLSAPFFRWTGTDWVDATGDYDLCLSQDQKNMLFTNRRPQTETYAYRYVSIFWLVGRLGVRK